jgi:GTPase SAR1 family protein
METKATPAKWKSQIAAASWHTTQASCRNRPILSREEKGKPLLELKLLLVGRGKAGKTTLVKQLVGDKPDKNELETHSISIREFILDCPEAQFGPELGILAAKKFFTPPISSS